MLGIGTAIICDCSFCSDYDIDRGRAAIVGIDMGIYCYRIDLVNGQEYDKIVSISICA